jgi:hypothetical protein
MDQLWRFLEGESTRGSTFTPDSILLSLLLAFVLGQALAWVYQGTHTGLSYSSSFVQSVILIAVVVSLVMGVIGSSIITAFGLMGALAMVRFRNVIKDTRDVVFVFAALVIGLAAGSQRYAEAIVGTALICIIAAYLRLTAFGSHRAHNAFLRFSLAHSNGALDQVGAILKRFCDSMVLISTQDNDVVEATEYSFQLAVRDTARNDALLAELVSATGMSNISLTMEETLLEV